MAIREERKRKSLEINTISAKNLEMKEGRSTCNTDGKTEEEENEKSSVIKSTDEIKITITEDS